MLDSKLPQHLSHWGIDIMRLEKTDKSMTEMEVELNVKVRCGVVWCSTVLCSTVLCSIVKCSVVKCSVV